MGATYYAVKQLTASDLTFFSVHLAESKSKQKGINLNADVFLLQFYPSLQHVFAEVPFQLNIFGPGGRPADVLRRKALRSDAYKNWRLNGEMVGNPEGDPSRYNSLQPGDFAVFAFEGAERPGAVKMLLVGAVEDGQLHKLIGESVQVSGRRSMVAVTSQTIATWREKTQSAYPTDNPLDYFTESDTVEQALYGTQDDVRKLPQSGGRSAPITPEQLLRQLELAQSTGQRGEWAFMTWLSARGLDETEYEWVSSQFARSAFDFTVSSGKVFADEGKIYIDVKSTSGGFSQDIHMSLAELRWAASNESYRIARVYGFDSGQQKLAMLKGVSSYAREILAVLDTLPLGTKIDSICVTPSIFTVEFEEVIADPLTGADDVDDDGQYILPLFK